MSRLPLEDRVGRAYGQAAAALRRWGRRQYLAYCFRRDRDHPALSLRAAAADLREADSVLVLSRANVCRGPFAERYLRERLAARGIDAPPVDSAGFDGEGRTSPPAAVEAAAGYGVDLADHRSVPVRKVDVAGSVLLVPDCASYHAAVTRFPGREGHTYFLSAFADRAPGVRIPEPLGKGYDRIRDAFDVISRAADGVLGVLAAAATASASAGDGPRARR